MKCCWIYKHNWASSWKSIWYNQQLFTKVGMNSNHWILTNLQSGEVNIHHFQPHWVKFLFHINIPHWNQRITCNLFLSIYQKMVRYATSWHMIFSFQLLVSSAAWRWIILGDHFGIGQSECTKSTIHLCIILLIIT